MAKSPQLFSAIALLTIVACGSSDGDEPDASVDPINLRGHCDEADHVGAFEVSVTPMFSAVDGQVHDGVLPISIRDEVTTSGDCKLMRRLNPFCDPGCTGQQVCDHDGQCKARPNPQDVGTITVSGLEEEITMEPQAPGNNYFATPATNPIFLPDAEIRLRSTDGTYGVMALGGFGFTPLELPAGDWVIAAGQALEVNWTAPAAASPSTHVFFRLTIDQHGTSPVALECEFEDDGNGTIEAALVDALLNEGVSGFPNGTATRRTTDKISISDGCVDFAVASELPNRVVVEGHTPCDDNDDCPEGQTCDIPNETCVDE